MKVKEERLLEILKSSDGYVSGEEISRRLDVSRTAVWKAVNKLRSKGFRILSATNRGYMMENGPDVLMPGEIKQICATRKIGKNIFYSPECGSTNDMAREGEKEGHEEGSVYITDYQSAGRGRMGRGWHFEPNKAVAMSVLLKPVIPPNRMMPVSLIAGIAAVEALMEETGLECKLKWPNDIIIGDKKTGGILTESSTEGEYAKFIIVGIGINCNSESFPEDLKGKATSVFVEKGKECSRKAVICNILEKFEDHYTRWMDEYNAGYKEGGIRTRYSYTDIYRRQCITLGKRILATGRSGEIEGVAEDIDELGNLVVQTSRGERLLLSSGEVSIRGEKGYI